MRSIDLNPERTTAYINAGGRGTRLNGVDGVPAPHAILGVTKALLEVGRPPIKLIDHHLKRLKWLSFDHVVVSAGDQTQVADYIARNYDKRHVTTVTFPEQHGNAGDMLKIMRQQPELLGDQIFIQNVDTILDINAHAFVNSHRRTGADATIALTSRRGVPNQDAFGVDANGMIVDSRESGNSVVVSSSPVQYRASSTGAITMRNSFVAEYPWDGESQLDMYKGMLGTALARGSLAGYFNGDRFFMDVGTAQTYAIAQDRSGPVQPHLNYLEPLEIS